DPDGVRDAIFTHLQRGVTLLEARGGFTGRPRPMLYVVVAAHEVGRLKLRVAEVDAHAFVAISSAQEVFGEGFTPAQQEGA
ncbi:MAG TPA: YitT family protein, partial [Candidatus Sulfomarinibacteraceae bacterium]|nr:YitT family protein [Candidatus Sulfomarinibacteraceae bacterium]